VQPPRLARAVLVVGLVLVAVGASVLAFVPTTQFGWFAYAPLSDTTYTPGVVLGTAQLWGAAAGAVGLAAASGAAGYLAGRAAGRRAGRRAGPRP
jgi:heme/copper-type cytochrome/quinol oxidase subunit 1